MEQNRGQGKEKIRTEEGKSSGKNDEETKWRVVIKVDEDVKKSGGGSEEVKKEGKEDLGEFSEGCRRTVDREDVD